MVTGPPLWDDCAAQKPDEGALGEPDWDMANQYHPTTPKISVPFGEYLVVV